MIIDKMLYLPQLKRRDIKSLAATKEERYKICLCLATTIGGYLKGFQFNNIFYMNLKKKPFLNIYLMY